MKTRLTIGVSGLSARTPSVRAMMQQIRSAGAEAKFLTYRIVQPERAAKNALTSLDALVVMGNDLDIDPKRYIDRYGKDDPKRQIHPETKSEISTPNGKARARYEEALLRHALAMGMPILGICGGMQRLNVLLGGTLHQHIPDLVGCNKHMQRTQGIALHLPVLPILIKDATTLAEIACNITMPFTTCSSTHQPKVIMENSMHHQAVDRIGEHLRVCAVTDTVKRGSGAAGFMAMAVESDPEGAYANQFILGVQWHPEFGASSLGERIVARLVAHACRFACLKGQRRTRRQKLVFSNIKSCCKI